MGEEKWTSLEENITISTFWRYFYSLIVYFSVSTASNPMQKQETYLIVLFCICFAFTPKHSNWKMDEGTVFVEELSQRLRPLNDLVEELQAIGLDFYIKLPSIAVVGEQSTGFFSPPSSFLCSPSSFLRPGPPYVIPPLSPSQLIKCRKIQCTRKYSWRGLFAEVRWVGYPIAHPPSFSAWEVRSRWFRHVRHH